MKKTVVHISSDLEPLMPRYLENRRADVAVLKAAAATANFEQVRALAHTMKGSGASFGLETISDIGRALEEAAKSSNTALVETFIQDFAHFLETLEIIFVDDMP